MTLSNKEHVECIVRKGKEEKNVWLPQPFVAIGKVIQVQRQTGWEIIKILGQPQSRPEPLKKGSLKDNQ